MNRKKRKEILAVTLAGIIGLSPSLAVFGSQGDGDHTEDLYEQEAEALYQEWLRAFEKEYETENETEDETEEESGYRSQNEEASLPALSEVEAALFSLIKSKLQEDGVWKDTRFRDWLWLAAARAGLSEEEASVRYCDLLEQEVKDGEMNSGDYARAVLALTAGADPDQMISGYDLLSHLDYLAALKQKDWETAALILLALDSHSYGDEEGKEKLVSGLLSAQKKDGYWESMGNESRVSVTALVLMALSPYRRKFPKAEQAAASGSNWLFEERNSRGGYDGGIHEEGRVLTLLCTWNTLSLGIYDTEIAKLYEEMTAEGAWNSDRADESSIAGLTALLRMQNGQLPLYGMADVNLETSAEMTVEEWKARVNRLPFAVDTAYEDEIMDLKDARKQLGRFFEKETYIEKLEDAAARLEQQKHMLRQFDQRIQDAIDLDALDQSDRAAVRLLMGQYAQLSMADRSFLTSETALLTADCLTEKLNKDIIPKEIFERIQQSGKSFTYQGSVNASYRYQLKAAGAEVKNPADMDTHIYLISAAGAEVPAGSFGFALETEGSLPSVVEIRMNSNLENGVYHLYHQDSSGTILPMGETEVNNGSFTVRITEGGSYYVGEYEKVEEKKSDTQAENPKAPTPSPTASAKKSSSSVKTRVSSAKKSTSSKAASSEKKSTTSETVEPSHGIVGKSFFEKIKGQKSGIEIKGKTEDSREFKFGFKGADITEAKDTNVEIETGSAYEEEIRKLSENPSILHLKQEGAYPGKANVKIQIDREDGPYLLLWYNPEERKAEYVQRVHVENGETTFTVEKGGHYFIDTRAKTDSLNDLEEDGSVMVSENRVNPIKGELRESEETLSGEVHLSQNSGYQGRANQRKKLVLTLDVLLGAAALIGGTVYLSKRKQKKERAGE